MQKSGAFISSFCTLFLNYQKRFDKKCIHKRLFLNFKTAIITFFDLKSFTINSQKIIIIK